MKTISERVDDYLGETGTTKTWLAKRLGFSRTTLNSKLNGEVDFKLSEAQVLAGIIGCTIDEFQPTATKEVS